MGTHGVAANRAPVLAHPRARQQLAAAPVLGRPDAAAAGQLAVVAAAPAAALVRCKPLLDAIGRRTFSAGSAPACAVATTLSSFFLLCCSIEVVGGAFALIRKHEAAPEVPHDVVAAGLFAAPAHPVYGRMIVDDAYDMAGRSALPGAKDLKLILTAGELAPGTLPQRQPLA